ncbi:type II toxin-antitoxin system RelE/ParE family toxin [Methanobrevibacter sp.]|uniref:type II toxin-antitoxin system RelE family toxin n=1 Tax=Methanobrevibacter sp. TaxID=66852 RepID=UPI0026DFD3AB|nr:hypothetical protein [Methanobrevibacter sp.]MDO5860511.1 hypothetical protein [Methanobrevibacter sp.]
MELEFKRSTLRQLKYYKKKNPIAYKLIRKKLEGILNNPEDSNYKKVKKYPKYKRARKGNYRICFRVDQLQLYWTYLKSFKSIPIVFSKK